MCDVWLTLFTKRSPEAKRAEANEAISAVCEAASSVGTADQVAHVVAALAWHTAENWQQEIKVLNK